MSENDTVYPLFALFPVSMHFLPDLPCNAVVVASLRPVVVDAFPEQDFRNWLDNDFV